MSMASAPSWVSADSADTTEKTISSNQPPLRVVWTTSGVGTSVGTSGTAVAGAVVGSTTGGASVGVVWAGWQAAKTMLATIKSAKAYEKLFLNIQTPPGTNDRLKKWRWLHHLYGYLKKPPPSKECAMWEYVLLLALRALIGLSLPDILELLPFH